MSKKALFSVKRAGGNYPLGNIISEWKYEDNVLDTVGSNDGTATNLTYADGLVGRVGDFNSSSTKVDVADADNLSFTNGVNDLPFSFTVLVNFGTTATSGSLLTKYDGINNEYAFMVFGTTLNFALFNTGGFSNYINITHSFTRTTSTWYHITLTYDGSKSETGLTLYLDGVDVSGTQTEVGAYTGMTNTSRIVTMGYRWNGTYHNGQLDCIRIWDKELTPDEVSDIATAELNGTDINP